MSSRRVWGRDMALQPSSADCVPRQEPIKRRPAAVTDACPRADLRMQCLYSSSPCGQPRKADVVGDDGVALAVNCSLASTCARRLLRP